MGEDRLGRICPKNPIFEPAGKLGFSLAQKYVVGASESFLSGQGDLTCLGGASAAHNKAAPGGSTLNLCEGQRLGVPPDCPSISMDNRGDLGVACGVSADGGVGCLAFWDRVTEAFFQIRSVRSSFFGCNHSICIKANNGHPARWFSS